MKRYWNKPAVLLTLGTTVLILVFAWACKDYTTEEMGLSYPPPPKPGSEGEQTAILDYNGGIRYVAVPPLPVGVPIPAEIRSEFCDLPNDATMFIDRDGMRAVIINSGSLPVKGSATPSKENLAKPNSECQGSSQYSFICMPQKTRIYITNIPDGCSAWFDGSCVHIECISCPSKEWCCKSLSRTPVPEPTKEPPIN